eukprot:GHVS01090289.1.p1 GENE.GHVS01090289.1~~GHVS01090289.1.p1  ORF type:complete len:168 (+),score=26.58 GHVS01090289.1:75-506(+)
MCVVECVEEFDVPVDVLFEVFVNESILTRMARGATTRVDAKVGGAFSLFDGNIVGSFEVIDKNRRIVERWRFKDWNDGEHSTVELTFTSTGPTSTKVELKQTDIPAKDKYDNSVSTERCTDGWNINFWERIDQILGYSRRQGN